MEEVSTSTQTVAESGATSAAPPRDSAPPPADARPQLASFAEALDHAERSRGAVSKGTEPPTEATGSDGSGKSTAQVSNADPPVPPSDPEPASADDDAEGEPASTDAPKPTAADADKDGKGNGRPSRRGAAEIARLTQERDEARAQLATLAVPDEVVSSLRAVILDDATFNTLAAKKAREDLTGTYLTSEEAGQYAQALQVREWLSPAFKLANEQAAAWANGQIRQSADAQAADLAPVLEAKPYITREPIARAASWADVYTHLCDASEKHGREAERSEWKPKLDQAEATIAELESELKSLRPRARTGPVFERAGVSGGAYNARPEWKTAKAADFFTAAEQQAEQRRARQAARRSA